MTFLRFFFAWIISFPALNCLAQPLNADNTLGMLPFQHASSILWMDIMEASGRDYAYVHPGSVYPVSNLAISLSITEAADFCEAQGKRLPTSAEWLAMANLFCGDFPGSGNLCYPNVTRNLFFNVGNQSILVMSESPVAVFSRLQGVDAAGTLGLLGGLPEWTTAMAFGNSGLSNPWEHETRLCGGTPHIGAESPARWSGDTLCSAVTATMFPMTRAMNTHQTRAGVRCIRGGRTSNPLEMPPARNIARWSAYNRFPPELQQYWMVRSQDIINGTPEPERGAHYEAFRHRVQNEWRQYFPQLLAHGFNDPLPDVADTSGGTDWPFPPDAPPPTPESLLAASTPPAAVTVAPAPAINPVPVVAGADQLPPELRRARPRISISPRKR